MSPDQTVRATVKYALFLTIEAAEMFFHAERLRTLFSGRSPARRRAVARKTGVNQIEAVEPRQLLTMVASGLTFHGGSELSADDIAVRNSAEAAQIQQALIDNAVARYREILGQEAPGYRHWFGWCGRFPYADALLTSGFRSLALTASSDAVLGQTLATFSASTDQLVSTTNTQEQGVDEIDLVETDGKFLFVVNGRRLSIIETGADGELTPLTEIDLPGAVHGLFLNGDVLTVVSDWAHEGTRSNGLRVDVSVFDVTDRSNPVRVSQTVLDGSFNTARQIGDDVYVVLGRRRFSLPEPRVNYACGEPDSSEVSRYENEDEYRASLQDYFRYKPVPQQYSVSIENGKPVLIGEQLLTDDRLVDYSGHYVSPRKTTVVSIDTRATGNPVTDFVNVDGSHDVYLTDSSLYLFGYDYGINPGGQRGGTAIERFSLDNGQIGEAVRGAVPGRVLNSFSLDESEGSLRIATTTRIRSLLESAVYVLQEQDGELAIVGSVTGIGVGQEIYAARFIGDSVYLITFRRVDPLHVIDLSDPLNPVERGELEIPGFSNYLEPYDENHLIGIGRDEHGRLQVSLFDISDSDHPERVGLYTFKDLQAASSLATNDHHAVTMLRDDGRLIIPIHSLSLGEPVNGHRTREWLDNFAVLSIDPDTGIQLEETIEHDSRARRSLRIGESLITVSKREVASHDLEDLSMKQGSVTIAPEELLPVSKFPDLGWGRTLPPIVGFRPIVWLPSIPLQPLIFVTESSEANEDLEFPVDDGENWSNSEPVSSEPRNNDPNQPGSSATTAGNSNGSSLGQPLSPEGDAGIAPGDPVSKADEPSAHPVLVGEDDGVGSDLRRSTEETGNSIEARSSQDAGNAEASVVSRQANSGFRRSAGSDDQAEFETRLPNPNSGLGLQNLPDQSDTGARNAAAQIEPSIPAEQRPDGFLDNSIMLEQNENLLNARFDPRKKIMPNERQRFTITDESPGETFGSEQMTIGEIMESALESLLIRT